MANDPLIGRSRQRARAQGGPIAGNLPPLPEKPADYNFLIGAPRAFARGEYDAGAAGPREAQVTKQGALAKRFTPFRLR